jgi:hypothetical protein
MIKSYFLKGNFGFDSNFDFVFEAQLQNQLKRCGPS